MLGYMLCPFNVNFFVISRHWGLNPYDADFTSISSGDTPNAENEMFASLGIRPSKSVRKLYQKFPQGIISYAAVKDLGITDVNLLMKSATPKWYAFFKSYMISISEGEIDYPVRNPLRLFVHDMLEITNQKTVWNSLERTVGYLSDEDISNVYVTDGIQMYSGCAGHLTDREKRQILSEGFNRYTHDFLMRRNNQMAAERAEEIRSNEWKKAVDENEVFEIEQPFLALEYKAGEAFRINANKEHVPVPDEDRYCFFVAKDSLTLKVIGSEMKNCVGWGYAEAVRNRRSTIVYAVHKGKYKICIEVTPSFSIRQAFGPCNQELQGEAFEAYSEWCYEKHIARRKAFSRRCAPAD
ncbi:PcfJ domain-containing protein [Treponema sp.]|uniref:PcfJ domain-containing protein n=1 Tax=Treponema sp. TaxID=166 RepID=UPI003F02F34B